jgi:hypothetical protein
MQEMDKRNSFYPILLRMCVLPFHVIGLIWNRLECRGRSLSVIEDDTY